jgi:uncharacterized HAD superfamily protein
MNVTLNDTMAGYWFGNTGKEQISLNDFVIYNMYSLLYISTENFTSFVEIK